MEDAHGDVFDDLPEAVRSEWDQLVRTVAQLREVRNALNAYNDKITASIEKNAILLNDMKVVEEERNKGLKPKRGVKLEEGREYEPAGFAPLPRRRVVELRQMILGKYFDRATFGHPVLSDLNSARQARKANFGPYPYQQTLWRAGHDKELRARVAELHHQLSEDARLADFSVQSAPEEFTDELISRDSNRELTKEIVADLRGKNTEELARFFSRLRCGVGGDIDSMPVGSNRQASRKLEAHNKTDCMIRWMNFADPDVGTENKWSPEQKALFQAVVTKPDVSSTPLGAFWQTMSDLMSEVPGDRKHPLHCLVYWRREHDTTRKKESGAWTPEDDKQLKAQVNEHGENWVTVAEHFETRSEAQCMQRFRTLVKLEVRGKWREEEDARLVLAIKAYGGPDIANPVARRATTRKNDLYPVFPRRGGSASEKKSSDARSRAVWTLVRTHVGRSETQCRERWVRSLRLTKRGPWTAEEDTRLVALYHQLGSKWAEIARQLGDRNDGACKRRLQAIHAQGAATSTKKKGKTTRKRRDEIDDVEESDEEDDFPEEPQPNTQEPPAKPARRNRPKDDDEFCPEDDDRPRKPSTPITTRKKRARNEEDVMNSYQTPANELAMKEQTSSLGAQPSNPKASLVVKFGRVGDKVSVVTAALPKQPTPEPHNPSDSPFNSSSIRALEIAHRLADAHLKSNIVPVATPPDASPEDVRMTDMLRAAIGNALLLTNMAAVDLGLCAPDNEQPPST